MASLDSIESLVPVPLRPIFLDESTPTPPVLAELDGQPGALRHALDVGANVVRGAVVAVEVNPLTNELPRYAGYLYALHALRAHHVIGPIVDGVVIGAETFLLEAGAGWAAAKGVASGYMERLFNGADARLREHRFLRHLSPVRRESSDASLSLAAEVGTAAVAGSVVALVAKKRTQPEMTAADCRKRSMLTAACVSGMLAVEGVAVAEGVMDYNNPVVKLAAAGLFGFAAARRMVKGIRNRRITRYDDNLNITMQAQGIVTGVELKGRQLEESIKVNRSVRDHDPMVNVGLFGPANVRDAMEDPRTVSIQYAPKHGKPVYAPFLVPIDRLEWYNLADLKERYGADTPLYCYVHPPTPGDEASQAMIAEATRKIVDDGGVIIYDEYMGSPVFSNGQWHAVSRPRHSAEATQGDLVESGGAVYELDTMATGKREKLGVNYAAELVVNGVQKASWARSIRRTYNRAVRKGEIVVDPQNGEAMEWTMCDDDIKHCWEIYEKPFENLTKGNPILAGFDEAGLAALLRNPQVAKAIYRENGQITNVCVLTNNLDICPWFNPAYFAKEFAEYAKTNNIFMFPSIVSDPTKIGRSYSGPVLGLIAKILAKRGSNALIAWENTEKSTIYIPRIVETGVNDTGVATIRNARTPRSVIKFRALHRPAQDEEVALLAA